MKVGIRFKKADKKSFDYVKFEKNLLAELEAFAKKQSDNKDDLYIMSVEYFPEFTTYVAVRANSYSYLTKNVGESEKYYTYYKYCEEEWGLGECLEDSSKELQAEYKKMEEKYDDVQFDEWQREHAVKIFSVCKTVMKKFKETDTYKMFSKLYLNVYMRERFTKEEILQVFCELNGEDNKEEYSDWL